MGRSRFSKPCPVHSWTAGVSKSWHPAFVPPLLLPSLPGCQGPFSGAGYPGTQAGHCEAASVGSRITAGLGVVGESLGIVAGVTTG